MAFKDPIAYLVIKIWIKSKLPKIMLQPKIMIVKIENPKGPICTKIKPKKRPKIQPRQQKRIRLICNLVTTCSLCSTTLIGHISLISTLNCDMFEALDSWIPKFQKHMWFTPRNLLEVALILAQSWHHCVVMHFMQPCFNWSYLPRFNSKLQSV